MLLWVDVLFGCGHVQKGIVHLQCYISLVTKYRKIIRHCLTCKLSSSESVNLFSDEHTADEVNQPLQIPRHHLFVCVCVQ